VFNNIFILIFIVFAALLLSSIFILFVIANYFLLKSAIYDITKTTLITGPGVWLSLFATLLITVGSLVIYLTRKKDNHIGEKRDRVSTGRARMQKIVECEIRGNTRFPPTKDFRPNVGVNLVFTRSSRTAWQDLTPLTLLDAERNRHKISWRRMLGRRA
ncbi:MAG: hypothetical protein KAT34_21070, partial [Candidatus Aminicenantes bacterium]|nr:hypothetical protein [Candidatus Aminicenantes bacterium]